MDAIRQYLELYAGHRELFDNNSAHVLNRLRGHRCHASVPKTTISPTSRRCSPLTSD